MRPVRSTLELVVDAGDDSSTNVYEACIAPPT